MSNLKYHIRRGFYSMLAGIDKLMSKENDRVIFVFHSISDDQWFFGNSRAQLESYIKEISKHYKIISLSEMHDVITKKKNYLQKICSITFDDGYKNLLSVAQYFHSLQIKPTVFVVSDPSKVNVQQLETSQELLSESDILLLNKMFGWEIGSHTATHADLDLLSTKELAKEISGSKNKLEKLLNSQVSFFAYPKGKINHQVLGIVKNSGYKAAFTMDHQEITLLHDTHKIPRVGINRTHTPKEVLHAASPSSIVFRRIFSRFVKKIW